MWQGRIIWNDFKVKTDVFGIFQFHSQNVLWSHNCWNPLQMELVIHKMVLREVCLWCIKFHRNQIYQWEQFEHWIIICRPLTLNLQNTRIWSWASIAIPSYIRAAIIEIHYRWSENQVWDLQQMPLLHHWNCEGHWPSTLMGYHS